MSEKNKVSRRDFLLGAGALSAAGVLAACAPQVVEKTVEVEKIVEKEVPVEVEKEVVKEVEVEVTAAPPAKVEEIIRSQHWAGDAFSVNTRVNELILEKTGITPETKVNDLTEEEIIHLREIIDQEYRVEGELRKEVNLNIKRLMEIGCYRGIRHRHNLPVRGQRTKTNARARRGTRQTVAGRGQRRGMTKK